MRIKSLFSIPNGEKVTEKALRKVLISSICSILLCMTCLVSTTWAWFVVSIENTGNEIAIAAVTPTVTITATEGTVTELSNGGYTLTKGVYSVNVSFTKEVTAEDVFGVKSGPVYLVISAIKADDTPKSYYIAVENDYESVTCAIAIGDVSANISFSVSWVPPATADEIADNKVTIGEISTVLTDAPTTEPSSDPTTEDPAKVSEGSGEDQTTGPVTETTTENTTETAAETAAEPTAEPITE